MEWALNELTNEMPLTRRKLLKAFFAAAALTIPSKAFAHHFFVRAPIIVGHDMNDAEEYYKFTTTIKSALAHDYTPVSMYDLLVPIVSGLPLYVNKPLIVTLDDGFESQLKLLDFLTANNISATFYLIPNYDDGRPRIKEKDYPKLIDAGQVAGAHTTKHKDMTLMSIDDAVADAALSQTIIQQATGKKCPLFAFPEGSFSNPLIMRLSAHFVSAVSTAPGVYWYQKNGGRISFRDSPVEHMPENSMCLNRIYAFY